MVVCVTSDGAGPSSDWHKRDVVERRRPPATVAPPGPHGDEQQPVHQQGQPQPPQDIPYLVKLVRLGAIVSLRADQAREGIDNAVAPARVDKVSPGGSRQSSLARHERGNETKGQP